MKTIAKNERGGRIGTGSAKCSVARAEEFKRRMLAWPNPVEYVNNMYACHPGDGSTEYFKAVFGK
jgi:hypothetical protein